MTPFILDAHALSANDYPEWYQGYVALSQESGISALLINTVPVTEELFSKAPTNWLRGSYAPGKWTPLQLLEHIADAELIFATRLLALLRKHNVAWPGFDENLFVENGQAHQLGAEHLLLRMQAVRQTTLLLANEVHADNQHDRIVANGNSVSALALLAITAGHHQHHLNILHQRYPLSIEHS